MFVTQYRHTHTQDSCRLLEFYTQHREIHKIVEKKVDGTQNQTEKRKKKKRKQNTNG